MELPPLGDPSKLYSVELTEPEINAIHGAFGFMHGVNGEDVSLPADVRALLLHYLPVLEVLSERLGVFDDGDAARV